jgi:transposase
MTIDKSQSPSEEIDAVLPDDVVALKALVLEQRAQLATRVAEIEQLKLLIAKLRRMQFGRSSERLDRQIEQMELRLEESQTAQAELPTVAKPQTEDKAKPVRRALPELLPRESVVHEPSCTCPDCGRAMKRIGEDVSEVLDYVPAPFRVIRYVRPKLACPACERIVQVEAPSRPIERGAAGAGLLAHVLVSKYAITCRSIARRRSMRVKAWNWNARPSLSGWADVTGYWIRLLKP